MPLTSVLLAALLQTAAPADPPANTVAPVVVTATAPDRARPALEACIERGCEPGEEMRLTLRSAEESFLAGQYRDAQSTLRRAIRRNARHADEHPVLLAGVHKANTTVHRHLGFGEIAKRSSTQVIHLLKRAYGEDSPEVMWARLDRVDALALNMEYAQARLDYEKVQADARARGYTAIERAAEVRAAWMYAAMPMGTQKAKGKLREIVARSPDRAQSFAARVLLLRLALREKADAEVQQLIAGLQGIDQGTEKPVLLYDPPPVPDRGEELSSLVQPPPSTGDPTGWIDAGFWINSEGRVEEAEVLRTNKPGDRWHQVALQTLARRVYAPLRPTAEQPKPRVYRIERLALTSLVLPRLPTGTHIPVRHSRRTLHAVDLTEAKAPEPAK